MGTTTGMVTGMAMATTVMATGVTAHTDTGVTFSNDGAVRIEVGPKSLRDEAQVYVNEAHVGVVDDFDGFFQRLSLTPGEYDIEIRLEGYQTLQARIFVRRGSTYKIRESLQPVVAN